ncbi:hypothetical protein [Moorena producens]|uniref:hypothetical protein n=1 Tax=Moorena producens TaxID=1155739 RepID=UPI003C72AD5D
MAYTHFRYIAYQVPTVGQTVGGNAIYGIPAGNITNAPTLLGDTGSLSNDARTRVERFIKVMYAAADRIYLEDNAQTLKIFMAPEFYFRPDNVDVSYSMQEYRAIKDVLRNTISEFFPNWLVIPGTIMWKWDQNTVKRPNPLNQDVYFNTSLYIYKKLFQQSTGKVIEKAQASVIDGIPTGRHGNPQDSGGLATNELFIGKYQTLPKKQKHKFVINGIICGLEICLEHDLYANGLLNSLANSRDPNNGIQLHLLTTGGMPIQPQSVATRPGGYILRTDGYSDPPQVHCRRVANYRSGSAKLYNTTLKSSIPLTGDLNMQEPTNADASDWNATPQKIQIYERCPIP